MGDEQPNTDNEPKDKKIIVDEDWKSHVEEEKQAVEEAQSEQAKRTPMPPASMALLITQMATQASLGMGDIENPATGKAEPDLALAKHSIDMLEVLEQKTKGNLDSHEKQLLDAMLFQLRMRYVAVSQGPAQ